MKLILKQTFYLLAALAALYGLLLAVTLALVPRADFSQRMDTTQAGNSLYLTEPKYVFMTRSRLNTVSDKVLLVGASNMAVGFRQSQLQQLLPQAEVHNLAVGGSNATQVRQVVDLVREVQSPEARRHNTVVIGLWYGLFADDKARWHSADRHAGDTDIDIERYRYGFYKRTDDGPVPVLSPEHLDLGVTLIHPYLVLDRTARDLTKSLRSRLAGKAPAMTDEQRNAVLLSATEKQKYLEFWREYMGNAPALTDAPFNEIARLVDTVVADGGRVVLVDLPIPQWHASGSPLYADYRRRADELVARLASRGRVTVVAMSDAAADDDFSDEVHPKPRAAPRWAERLASGLTQTIPITAQAAGGSMPVTSQNAVFNNKEGP